MRSGRPTIRDVARAAGVGVGTVSRVLSNAPHVRPQTRERILRAVQELKFRPSRTAQGLARGRTQTLAVLVPFFTKHYFLEILRGIEQSVSASDYSLIVYSVERREQALAHLESLAGGRRADGLIVISLSGRLIERAYPEGPPLPLVCVDTQAAGALALSVDHEQGMYLAVRHLAQLGHRRIALIDRPQDPVSGTRSRARRKGYLKACAEASLPAPEAYRVLARYSQEAGHGAAGRLLDLQEPPTALACASDLQAIGALEAAAERGLRVGTDVAVTGYHDVELARYVGLTTVHVPAWEMGRAAAALLVKIAAAEPHEESIPPFKPELVVRRSSGAWRREGGE